MAREEKAWLGKGKKCGREMVICGCLGLSFILSQGGMRVSLIIKVVMEERVEEGVGVGAKNIRQKVWWGFRELRNVGLGWVGLGL